MKKNYVNYKALAMDIVRGQWLIQETRELRQAARNFLDAVQSLTGNDEVYGFAVLVALFDEDKDDPFGSTERFFRTFMREVDGRTKVYFPILAYNFSKTRPGYVALARWAHVPRTDRDSRGKSEGAGNRRGSTVRLAN